MLLQAQEWRQGWSPEHPSAPVSPQASAPGSPQASAPVSAPVRTDNVTARLVAERSSVAPGGSVDLALVLDIRPHWHTYWRNPGDSGEPPRITWELPDGITAGSIRWPLPDLIPVGPLANYGYSERAVHLVRLQVSADWPPGEPIPVRAEAHWLVCEEACIPEQGSFSLTLATGASGAEASPTDSAIAALFAATRDQLPAPGKVASVLERSGTGLRLQVPAGALPVEPDEVLFFADAWGLIEHAAPQDWTLDGDALHIDLVPGATPGSVAPTGLLVLRTTDARHGLEIDASGMTAALALDAASASASAGDAPLTLPLALAFALLGGLILNLMPCVFPVLAVKALGLARQGGRPLAERAAHGLAYAGGVLAFFALVALVLLGLRAGGAAVGWGFQLQSPMFVTLMAYLFLVLGLGLTGAVTIGARLMGLGAVGAGPAGESNHGHAGAFLTGALAALVAAPCTAPFMGAALGYAVTLPWLQALLIMLTVGLGMALPFLLLALAPGLAARLPRPGPWMEHLKQFLAFPLFATAAWLVWVLSVQVGPSGVAAVLAGMIGLTLALWLAERARNADAPWRQVALGGAALGLGAALWLAIGTARLEAPALASSPDTSAARLSAEPYAPGLLADARAEPRPVFVNMTAAWCITCLVNERVALSSDAVARAFAAQDVLYLKGDWTNRDPLITDYLAGFGRNGVPIYVLYPRDGPPRVLPQILTEAIVLEALEGA